MDVLVMDSALLELKKNRAVHCTETDIALTAVTIALGTWMQTLTKHQIFWISTRTDG
jgi:hypothetical protein